MSFKVTTDGEAAVVEAVVPLLIEKIVPVIQAMTSRIEAAEQAAERLAR
jgi:hypothetical protein